MIKKVRAVIFDLDGVIVKTDGYHYLAWKKLADELGIEDFSEEDGVRQRGVSRMASLEILLEKSKKTFSEEEKIILAERKNRYYVEMLGNLDSSAILPGIIETLDYLDSGHIKKAVGSVSKNTGTILLKTGLANRFDVVVDGTTPLPSKPDPAIFLLAAEKLGVPPSRCAVAEDSHAGIEAAKRGGMTSVAVGPACNSPLADYGTRETAGLPGIIRKITGEKT